MMWKEHYRIGSELIDTQHRELFKRVSNFVKVVQAGGSWDDRLHEVQSTLEFMQSYVVIHFDNEEQLQRDIGYPGLEEHVRIHTEFREEINEFAARMKREGFDEKSMQELAARVMTWLIMHVGKEDQKIGEFLRTQEDQK